MSRTTAQFIYSSVLLIVLCSIAAAQSSVAVVDFGIRGGAGFSDPPVLVSTNHYFPDSFQAQRFPYTVGPTVGVLLYDRVELRFEVVRNRFGYQSHSNLPALAGYSYASTTRGHSWIYPLLGTYRFSYGPVRPFAGGGLNLGGTTTQSTSGTSTVTTFTPSGPTTTTTSFTISTRPYGPSTHTAYYITGGIEGRTGYLTIRPELRYARWSTYRQSVDERSLNSPNQLEFLVGVAVHPFGKK